MLHADSHHGVTEVAAPRRTVVFNFWHAANTPELAAHVQALFAKLTFAELPAVLNPVAADAEANLPEDTTYLAGTTAVALQCWGYDDATVVAGYRYSAGLSTGESVDVEAHAAVLLADWVAHLYRESFDLARWELLRGELDGRERVTRLRSTWGLCFPEESGSKSNFR